MRVNKDGRLAGTAAIVTGSAKNIGRVIALYLAEEGASIVVNGLSDKPAAQAVADEIQAAGGRAVVQMGDVTRKSDANALAEFCMSSFGRIDFLICNPGLRKQTPFLQMTLEEWHRVLAVPLDGAFLTAKAAAPHMIATDAAARSSRSAACRPSSARRTVPTCAPPRRGSWG